MEHLLELMNGRNWDWKKEPQMGQLKELLID